MGMLEKIAMYSELWQKEVLEKEEAKKRLKRDSKGKPIIKLTPLEKTAVHTPTQEDYNTLMQVYECGGWKWYYRGKGFPTSFNYWFLAGYREKTCIRTEKKIMADQESYYQKIRFKVLSTQDFYNKQKITKSMINEIKEYFKDKK